MTKIKCNSVLSQIDSIRNHPLAGFVGFILGGFVPGAVYTVAHYQVQARWYLWVLVAGGLLYSAKTVYQWGVLVFGDRLKATGFVLLIEASMTFADGKLVPISALVLLVAINGVAAAHALAVGRPEPKPVAVGKPVKRSSGKSRAPRKPKTTALELVQPATDEQETLVQFG
jgi:hypothetical protein